jgi:hypothetical protein
MPPDQHAPSSGGATLDRLRADLEAVRTLLSRIEATVTAIVTTPDADALLALSRSETGSNTRTESVQQVGRP